MKTIIAVLVNTLWISGCVSVARPLPADLQYLPPADLVNAATVRGSKEVTKSKLIADRAAVIFNIDGKRNPYLAVGATDKRESNSTKPVYLAPGKHQLSVIYVMGGHITRPVSLDFVAQPNTNYEVRFNTDIGIGWNSRNTYADFWVVNLSSNKAVSPIVRGFTPARASPTYIPIIVPSR